MNLLSKREQVLRFYSPYSSLKEINQCEPLDLFIKNRISKLNQSADSFSICLEGYEFIFLYEYLKWDSEFLKRKCFKLFTVLFECSQVEILESAIHKFRAHLIKAGFRYGFIDIPAEDIILLQSLTKSGFYLVETRLHFFKDNLQDFNKERYPVRKATEEDLNAIVEVAKTSRNAYDRLHADYNFPNELADEYLGIYAKAAVNGFCDTVLIPDEKELPVASFLAISHMKEDSDMLKTKLARIVITAVGSANKGWHKKLVSEAVHYAKDLGASHVLMTTQATNRAVFRTCEKLGFKLGNTSHILSFCN